MSNSLRASRKIHKYFTEYSLITKNGLHFKYDSKKVNTFVGSLQMNSGYMNRKMVAKLTS